MSATPSARRKASFTTSAGERLARSPSRNQRPSIGSTRCSGPNDGDTRRTCVDIVPPGIRNRPSSEAWVAAVVMSYRSRSAATAASHSAGSGGMPVIGS
jgi:hypothetical protein